MQTIFTSLYNLLSFFLGEIFYALFSLNGCANDSDDQFDTLENQVSALATTVAGLSQVKSDITALADTVNSLQSSVAPLADTALSDGLADIAADIVALEAAIVDVTSSEDVADIAAAVDNTQTDLDELLATSSTIFNGNVIVNNISTLKDYHAMGEALNIVNGNVAIEFTNDMVDDATKVQELVNRILTITGDFKFTYESNVETEITFNNLTGVSHLILDLGSLKSTSVSLQGLVSATSINIKYNSASYIDNLNMGALTTCNNIYIDTKLYYKEEATIVTFETNKKNIIIPDKETYKKIKETVTEDITKINDTVSDLRTSKVDLKSLPRLSEYTNSILMGGKETDLSALTSIDSKGISITNFESFEFIIGSEILLKNFKFRENVTKLFLCSIGTKFSLKSLLTIASISFSNSTFINIDLKDVMNLEGQVEDKLALNKVAGVIAGVIAEEVLIGSLKDKTEAAPAPAGEEAAGEAVVKKRNGSYKSETTPREIKSIQNSVGETLETNLSVRNEEINYLSDSIKIQKLDYSTDTHEDIIKKQRKIFQAYHNKKVKKSIVHIYTNSTTNWVNTCFYGYDTYNNMFNNYIAYLKTNNEAVPEYMQINEDIRVKLQLDDPYNSNSLYKVENTRFDGREGTDMVEIKYIDIIGIISKLKDYTTEINNTNDTASQRLLTNQNTQVDATNIIEKIKKIKTYFEKIEEQVVLKDDLTVADMNKNINNYIKKNTMLEKYLITDKQLKQFFQIYCRMYNEENIYQKIDNDHYFTYRLTPFTGKIEPLLVISTKFLGEFNLDAIEILAGINIIKKRVGNNPDFVSSNLYKLFNRIYTDLKLIDLGSSSWSKINLIEEERKKIRSKTASKEEIIETYNKFICPSWNNETPDGDPAGCLDKDEDGVKDKDDKCPNTKPEDKDNVDENGCAISLPDYLKCEDGELTYVGPYNDLDDDDET